MKTFHPSVIQHQGRGRPPVPFGKTVAGKIFARLGTRKSIRWRLKLGGETGHDLLRSAGVKVESLSNEWVRQLIKRMFRQGRKGSPLSRSHNSVWRIARILRENNPQLTHVVRVRVARHFTSKSWVLRQCRRFGSFTALTQTFRLPEGTMRSILHECGIWLPRKPAEQVWLRCGYCGRFFSRLARLERRIQKKRKWGKPFCSQSHSARFVGRQYGFGRLKRNGRA